MLIKILKKFFFIFFALVIGPGLVSPFLYFSFFSPAGLTMNINCPLIDGVKSPSTDTPLSEVINNPEDFNNKKVYIDGRVAYYPRDKKFLLRDGLDYLTLDFSACVMSENWKRWSVLASVKGKFVVKNNEPTLLVDHLGENPPDNVIFYFFASISIFFIFLIIFIISVIKKARGGAAKKSSTLKKN